MSLEFKELDECMSMILDLQKSLEQEIKQREKNLTNQIIVTSIKDVSNGINGKEQVFQNDLICTDLDELIKFMNKEDEKNNSKEGFNKDNNSQFNASQKDFPSTSNYHQIKNDLCETKSKTISSIKELKENSHKNELFNRFCTRDKKISQYSSLPRIILDENEDILSVMYKSSSQTNLSQPNSDYKIPLTVYQPNRTIKTLLIDEFTTAGEICQVLTARNYLMPSVRFSLVEKIPHLKIERIFEDFETPVTALLSYADRESKPLIFFEDREDKYGLFIETSKWLGSKFSEKEDERNYIMEIFNGQVPNLPRYKSHLFYRKIQHKSWKRGLCILRNSGLYSLKKPTTSNPIDLELIIGLHPSLRLYTTTGGWCNSKAPTPYGFCLKIFGEQNPKYICYFCAPTESALRYWSSMFRIALNGQSFLQSYQNQLQFVSDTLDNFKDMNLLKVQHNLSKSLGCVTGRKDLHTDF